jgi:hypothetical protein
MLKAWTRVFVDKDGQITDRSIAAQDGNGFSCDLAASGEYLYIGQSYPFNNFTVELADENAATGAMYLSYWDGNQWRDCVDVLDGTVSGNATLGKNGTVQFTPNRNYGWAEVYDTSEESGFPLEDFYVYDLFWLRVRLQNDASAALNISQLRYKFCQHADLIKIDPEINQYLLPWGGASKTTWDEQIFEASDNIISKLKEKHLIMHAGQILRIEDVHKACVYETLCLIYSQLGLNDKYDKYEKKVREHLGDKRFTFDTNRSGTVDESEQDAVVAMGVR